MKTFHNFATHLRHVFRTQMHRQDDRLKHLLALNMENILNDYLTFN